MPTIQSGSTLERYFDNDTTITITPAVGGSVRFGCSSPVGATRPADRVIYSATSIAIPGGSTVFAQAEEGDAAYITAENSFVGIHPTADALESAYPSSQFTGCFGLVGTAAPYDLYESDGSVWRVRGSKDKAQDFGSTSGARAINCAKGTFCALTITGSTTISFTNGPSFNSAIRMTLNITNGGSNITWPAGTRWAGPGVVGSAPTLATTGTDKVVVEISNIAGTTYYDATYIGRVA